MPFFNVSEKLWADYSEDFIPIRSLLSLFVFD
jgi:hypothetical protein